MYNIRNLVLKMLEWRVYYSVYLIVFSFELFFFFIRPLAHITEEGE